MFRNLLKSDRYIYIALVVAALIFYGNTLQNGFVHDDVWQVEQNAVIKDLGNIPRVFTGCIAEEMLGGCKNIGFYYRPTQALVYLLVSQFSGQPWLFHLVNVLLGGVAGILVYRFLLLLFKIRLPALAGAVIFLTHPVNSEVFNWVSALPEILSAVFILLTFIFYLRFLEKRKSSYLMWAVLSFFPALLTKETAVFYLPVLALMTIFSQKSRIKLPVFYNLTWFLLPVLVYLGIRMAVLGRVVYKYEGYYGLSLPAQIFTGLSLLPKYLLELIFPWPLSFQPVVNPVFEYENTVTLSLIVLIALAGLIYYFYQNREKNLCLGLGIISLGILPALIFVNKLGENLFSERYVFIPVVGFCIVIIELLQKAAGRYKFLNRNVLTGMAAAYLILSFITIFQRAPDWKDNFSTYQAMIRNDPSHKKAHLMTGQLYQQRGEMQNAVNSYETALKIDPQYPEARSALDFLTKREKSKTGLSFYYPENWELQDTEEKAVITDKQTGFAVELTLQKLEKDEPVEKYIEKRKLTEGELKNQGLAKIPNFENAYVKVYDFKSKPKLQFFLTSGYKVVEAVVSPADSPLMSEFDRILGSIKIE